MRMVGRLAPGIVLILAMAASPALAETYKWVDAKGVVNYSSTPPPTAAKPQLVDERISVIPSDPSIGPAIAAMQARAERRAQYEEADYALRQRYMLEAQVNYAATTCPYGSICDAGYAAPAYYPYGYGGWGYLTGGARRFPPHATHHRASFRPGGGAPHARGMTHAGRGSSR